MVNNSEVKRELHPKTRVTLLEAENTLLKSQLEGIANPEPSREHKTFSGVCRDLTGGIPEGETG